MIEVISFFYNEEYLLPHYLKHYSYVDKITAFYDESSTDNTLKILESEPKVRIFPFKFADGLNETEKIYMINRAYRKSKAKYCIVADADEFVFRPCFMFRNIYFCRLWQMVGDGELEIDIPIKDQLCYGYYDRLYLKPSIVKTGKRFKFKEGHHQVTRFHVKKYPFFNIVDGLHLNMISYDFYRNRMLKNRIPRQSKYNIEKGFSRQFTNRSEAEVARKYKEALDKRIKLW